MNQGQSILSQILNFLPMYEFRKCVNRYNGNFRSRTFSCFDQFLCMAFAQLTYRESLRDIETCLRSFRQTLSRWLSWKNIAKYFGQCRQNRNWQIYSDFAHVLIQQARPLYQQDDFGVTLNQTAYAFDATTIDLCLSVFPWATGHQSAGGIKVQHHVARPSRQYSLLHFRRERIFTKSISSTVSPSRPVPSIL